MLKLTGSILVICATTLYGMRRAQGLREQYLHMEYLQQLFFRIQSEIRYARNPMSEIMEQVGATAREPYKKWFLELGNMFKKREGGAFAELWKTSIDKYLKEVPLPENERRRLVELGDRMGLMDIEMQVKTLELYLEQLSVSIKESREGVGTKVRLCHCLGAMSGIMLVILLL